MTSIPPSLPPLGRGMVRYPRLLALHDDIVECCQLSLDTLEPHCMALEGRSGAGKTWLVKDYASQFPSFQGESGSTIPVFYALMPSPATVKTTASKLLRALGDPAFDRGSLGSMTSRLIGLIADCEVQLVILDDIHHLIAPDTDKVLEQVSNWLKSMIKETGVPFLIVGIEGRVERVLRSNVELSRLFAVREKLTPFSWDEADPDTLREFASFVQLSLEVVGVGFSQELESREWLWRIYCATDGVVSYLMHLLRAAKLRAQGTPAVMTLPLLQVAFAKRLAKVFPHRLNPFLESHGSRFIPLPHKTLRAQGSGDASFLEEDPFLHDAETRDLKDVLRTRPSRTPRIDQAVMSSGTSSARRKRNSSR